MTNKTPEDFDYYAIGHYLGFPTPTGEVDEHAEAERIKDARLSELIQDIEERAARRVARAASKGGS